MPVRLPEHSFEGTITYKDDRAHTVTVDSRICYLPEEMYHSMAFIQAVVIGARVRFYFTGRSSVARVTKWEVLK